jgi:plasmid stabilization system protein ParE
MVYEITWTPQALQPIYRSINYLEQNWTEQEIKNFTKNLEDKIELLKSFSGIGSLFKKTVSSVKLYCKILSNYITGATCKSHLL